MMTQALLALWELPQNLLGLSLFGLEYIAGTVKDIELDRGRLFIQSKISAVSLGFFVFWAQGSNRYSILDEHTRNHEFGHSFQSRWLGPLYLPLVGIPSVARVLYSVAYRELTGRRWGGYFDGYPENWADRLGGVQRMPRARCNG
jgi:hypothetical protein